MKHNSFTYLIVLATSCLILSPLSAVAAEKKVTPDELTRNIDTNHSVATTPVTPSIGAEPLEQTTEQTTSHQAQGSPKSSLLIAQSTPNSISSPGSAPTSELVTE